MSPTNSQEQPPLTLSTKESLEFSIKVPEDYVFLKNLAQGDVEFIVRKDQTYGGSWRKRGGVGAYMMLARKWDRLENFAQNHSKQYDIFDLVLSAEDPEDILDDLKDLRNYLLLVESYLRQQMEVQPATEMADVVETVIKARKVRKEKALGAIYGNESKIKEVKPEPTSDSDPLKGYGGHYGYE